MKIFFNYSTSGKNSLISIIFKLPYKIYPPPTIDTISNLSPFLTYLSSHSAELIISSFTSTTIVLAYLMIYGKMSLLDAVKIVKSKKQNVFTSDLYLSIALNRIVNRI